MFGQLKVYTNGSVTIDRDTLMADTRFQTDGYKPLLQTGKEWVYDMAYYDGYGSDMVRRHADFRVWIETDTIISGRRYFKMRTDGSGSGYTLWYEEGRKVYQYNPYTEKSFLVYDFGMEKGDDASALGTEMISVMDADTILTLNETRKRIVLQNMDMAIVWIEGVGNPGMLEEPFGHMVSDGKVYSLLSCHENGGCVFETRHFCTPSFAPGTVPKRMWHNMDWHIDNFGKEYPDMNSQQTMWIAGEKTVEGRTYDVVRYQRGVSPWYVDSLLVRQEGTRVYAFTEDFHRVFMSSRQNVSDYYPCTDDEVLLYDFGMKEGDSFGATKVVEVWETEVGGLPRKCLTLDSGHRIVEGIGSLTGGVFDYMMKNVWDDEWLGRRRCLLDAYEEDGECILSKDNMDAILAIFCNSSCTPVGKDIVYDLQGRRLHDKPAKGIYIQNGRKFVVK